MNNLIKVISGIFFLFSTTCCNHVANTNSKSAFEKAYEEQFSELISQLEPPLDLSDTLYTEMYIALKLAEENKECEDTVLDRVSRLLLIDNNPNNQRRYLEAASIVYSARKDYDNFWKFQKLYYNTYPENSFERTSSYAMFYKFQELKPDSASWYIGKAKKAADKLLSSENVSDRIDGCLGMATMLIVEGNDEGAKSILKDYIKTEKDSVDIAQDALDNFQDFKSTILSASFGLE